MRSAPEQPDPDDSAREVTTTRHDHDPTAVDDAIGVLSAFAAKEVETYAGMLEEVLGDPERSIRLVSGLVAIATSRIDQVAVQQRRDRWELIGESRQGLERARRSNHPAHRTRESD